MPLCIESPQQVLHAHEARLANVDLLEHSHDDLASKVTQWSLDSIHEFVVRDLSIPVCVENFEETLHILWVDIDTVALNCLREFVLVQEAVAVGVHHLESTLQADQTAVPTHKQLVSELLNQKLLIFWHVLPAIGLGTVRVAVKRSLIAVRYLIPHFLLVFLSDFGLDGRARVHISKGRVAARSTINWLVVVRCSHQWVLVACLTGALDWGLWLHVSLLLWLLQLS